MAPRDFHSQTADVINYILYKEQYDQCFLEVDSHQDDGFDTVKIGEKLRELGDHYDETVIRPLIKGMKQVPVNQIASTFGNSVDALCRTWVAGRAEIVPEKELLRATVVLGLYVKKNCPDMLGPVQEAMISFVNNRLANWILQQGGWDQASSS